MSSKKFFSHFNIISQCRSYGLPVWQCPQVLFVLMGLCIIIVSVASYFIGSQFVDDPTLVALAVLISTMVFLIIAYTVTKNFERLAELSRLKSEFIDIVSHQMRSPLTNLKWTMELLSSRELNLDAEKETEYYENIKENIARMVDLIDDLLIVSRIDEEDSFFRKKDIVFEDLVKEVISRYAIFSKAANIQIEFNYPPEFPKVYMDPSWIKLAVENLVENAARYTKGGGKVDVSLKKNNDDMIFCVKDNGFGIPKDDQKFIFQKFFRAGNVVKAQTRGSGLGLYITKKIIKKSGGKIWFESEEGRGTTFCFTLPLSKS